MIANFALFAHTCWSSDRAGLLQSYRTGWRILHAQLRQHHRKCGSRAECNPRRVGLVVYPAFPVADRALLETALLQACDALDGRRQPTGLQREVRSCHRNLHVGRRDLPLTMHRIKKCDLLVGGANLGRYCKKINQGPRNSAGQAIAAPAGAVAEDPASNIAQGFV